LRQILEKITQIEFSSKNFKNPQIKYLQDIYTKKSSVLSNNSENQFINSKNQVLEEFEEYNESIQLPLNNLKPLRPKFNFFPKEAVRKQTSITNAEDENIYDPAIQEGFKRKDVKLLSLPSFKESVNLIREATTKDSHAIRSVRSLKNSDSLKYNSSFGKHHKSLRRRGSIEKNVLKFPFLDKFNDESPITKNEMKRKYDEFKDKSN